MMGRFLSYDSVDWSRTVAYSMGHVGQIYLNLQGREPAGIVRPETYQETLRTVMEALAELRDGAGRPMVTRMVPRDLTYHGPYAERGPDLHVEFDGYRWISFPLFATDGKLLTQQIRGDSGCHRREGILMAYGPGIKQGEMLTGAEITDLAPTILHLAGVPVPSEMDGRVLVEMLEAPGEVRYGDESGGLEGPSAWAQEETDEIEERLRGLGYL
jgi:predicted AlkP superfamily phosphohydrolase/phosphomutase